MRAIVLWCQEKSLQKERVGFFGGNRLSKWQKTDILSLVNLSCISRKSLERTLKVEKNAVFLPPKYAFLRFSLA